MAKGDKYIWSGDEWVNYDDHLRKLINEELDERIRRIKGKAYKREIDIGNPIEWDIDNNLPVYTKDFYKLYATKGHVCDCHRGGDQCLGCEALNCSFHENRKD